MCFRTQTISKCFFTSLRGFIATLFEIFVGPKKGRLVVNNTYCFKKTCHSSSHVLVWSALCDSWISPNEMPKSSADAHPSVLGVVD